MARKKSIKFLMKEALGKMASYGTSKHEMRELSKTKGVDLTKDKIFSYGTMNAYQAETTRYGNYLESKGLGKCSMDEAKAHIQEYLDYQSNRGLSAYSVHTTCAALSKTFQTEMRDYTIPERRLCNITRSRMPATHDARNMQRSGEVLAANRVLALRRNELKNLKVSNFTDLGNSIVMQTKGKGGKLNRVEFKNFTEISTIRDLIAEKNEDSFVFPREAFKGDTDFHQSRSEAFQIRYQRIVEDMKNRPEARAEYQQIIRDTFAASGRTLRENLDRPYYCRGSHREYLEAHGIAVAYDRTATLLVSLESHYRSDVLISHYLAK